jgi:1,4-dihydroxy-2-naphthoyl-CoA synthase
MTDPQEIHVSDLLLHNMQAKQAMACNRMDDVAQEGVQAFIDERTPSWRA